MFKTLMIVWLIAAIAALIAGVISAINQKFTETFIFLAITFMGSLMFFINKKRIEKMNVDDVKHQSKPTQS